MTDPKSHDLSTLLRAVCEARTDVQGARGGKASPGASPGAAQQRQLLVALEQYAAALDHHGKPMPYRMRNEMTMYREMFSARRR